MKQRVIILGAGVAGLEAALALNELAREVVAVELVSPDEEFVYRPLAVAEPFRLGAAQRFPLSHLVAETGAGLTRAAATAVDTDRKIVETSTGELPYDQLLVALGAKPVEAVSGALTFRGPQDEAAFGEVLRAAREGRARRIVFTMPAGISWPLPLYELALLTAVHLADSGAGSVAIELVTPEPEPLQLFGAAASEAILELFDLHGMRLVTDAVPVEVAKAPSASSAVRPSRRTTSSRFPASRGRAFRASLMTAAASSRSTSTSGCAATTTSSLPATPQTSRSSRAGSRPSRRTPPPKRSLPRPEPTSSPQPFTPVLRGLLLTGLTPRFLRLALGKHDTELDTEALWWPPAKIVGRYLAPLLAAQLHVSAAPPHSEGVEIDVELDRGPAGAWQRI